jgi:hypothetical protein
MTNQWVHVARQTLAIYFFVVGLLYLPDILSAFGTPAEGNSVWMLVVILLCQVVIAIGAAVVLFRITPRIDSDVASAMPMIIQLLGIYFVVEGLTRVVVSGGNALMFTATWQVRMSDFAGAIVGVGAGLLLVMSPRRVAATIASLSRSA